MTSCDVYRHQRLSSPRSIRLVLLHRNANLSPAQDLTCDLIEASSLRRNHLTPSQIGAILDTGLDPARIRAQSCRDTVMRFASSPLRQSCSPPCGGLQGQNHAHPARARFASTNQLRRVLSMKASEPRDKLFALWALSPGVLGRMRCFMKLQDSSSNKKEVCGVLYFSNRAKTTAGVPWDTLPSWTVGFATDDAEMRPSHKSFALPLGEASRSSRFRETVEVFISGECVLSESRVLKCVEGTRCGSDDSFNGEKEQKSGQTFQHDCQSPYLDVLGNFKEDVSCLKEPGFTVDKMSSSLCRLSWWIIQGPKKTEWSSSTPSSLTGQGITAVSSLVEWDSRHFGSQCRVALRVGRLFFTSDQIAGFAVTGVREGDAVCLIAGLDHLFILRPAKGDYGRYTLVGPTVFAGAMSGEMWPANEDELENFEVF
ncbi:hypothetical protein GCG54_00008241 [Colletotrichum gloeosporioides]|uniref:Heterokaryon incompatibility domain-containing protein n=1 Tax=Colletotrichum gloeosporioides TaxID=474922 RepID=A0A8H4FED5_COLGL|nr:uncharacterized protein GCG54_00008241 [Colletotrichum gloeosporioides]KAF3798785.1 hypothetical protein GCG54_00008241 [Colletotrichum gloeosporioides]